MDLLRWWNLILVLPALVALLYPVLVATGAAVARKLTGAGNGVDKPTEGNG